MAANTKTSVEGVLLPFDLIKNEIISLCKKGETGDLSIFTEEKHAAVISFHNGKIVGLRYRISRGKDALRLIQAISKGKIKFQKSGSNPIQGGSMDIPSTAEILKLFGVGVGVGVQNDTVQKPLKKSLKKILVVEDSATQRKVICRMLRQNEYDISEASDGYQALEKVDEIRPDLILLDIIMPGID
ncbi:MAG: response regulator, partial [Gammaproteobacteria bacterium]|nr:response regulator [Gammaproteobacteria bacterium]